MSLFLFIISKSVVEQPNETEEKVGCFKHIYRKYFKSEDGDSYVDTLLKLNAFMRALKFFPALFITVCLHYSYFPILN